MTDRVSLLIASSIPEFVKRFVSAFSVLDWSINVASDGFEALNYLESGRVDVLFVHGFRADFAAGLSGIAGDELSLMWRQIEGRERKLLVACVSEGRSEGISVQCRFKLDAEEHALNRGIDHHFWIAQTDEAILSELSDAVIQRLRSSALAASSGAIAFNRRP
jgi:hypothetical protein